MNRQLRSKNPDLLLPEVMDERITKTTDFWTERADVLNALDRMTVFVTHRCNLFCQYCNGPHMTLLKRDSLRKKQMLKDDLPLDSFTQLLEETAMRAKIRHIHFTGGEPTLNKNLPAFVEMAVAHGILSSITTNGTAGPTVYRELIKKGLTEIRISIDSYSSDVFDSIVGINGSFQKIIKSIQEIVHIRDKEGADVFLILNACVGEVNLNEIEKTLRFLISLNPNDIKFLVIAQDKEFVLNHQNNALIRELRKLLDGYPSNQFSLLRAKIDNLFNQNATGLKDQETQAVMEHCFIPMTERTIDGSHYYPCSIYLRYYGQPIGPLTDSFEEQQRKIMEFVRTHDCRTDPICNRHCTNCCKMFNVRANEASAVNADRIIEVKSDISEQEIEELLSRINSLLKKGKSSRRPFLIIKPRGQRWRNEIIAFMEKRGFEIESIAPIKDWPACAKLLYTWPLTKEEALFSLEMDRAFTKLEPGFAELIRFKKDPGINRLTTLKLDARRSFPTRRFQLVIGEKKRWIRLTAIHTPDAEDVKRENTILNALLKSSD